MATQPQNSKKLRDLAMGQKVDPWSEFADVPYLSEYGPGSVDYLEYRDKRQPGPLMNPSDIMMQSGQPGGPTSIENSLRATPKREPVWNTPIPGLPHVPEIYQKYDWSRYIVENDTGVKNDASPAPKAHEQPITTLENALLGILRGYEANVDNGTPLKLYNDVVQRGRKEPISEKDLTPAELKKLGGAVRKKGGAVGSFDYPDYRANMPTSHDLSHTLGGFQYEIDDDANVTVRDTYDFNTAKGSPTDNDLAMQIFSFLFEPRALAAAAGRKVAPPGKGLPVNIHIPAEDK
jgi:hypothetical protein